MPYSPPKYPAAIPTQTPITGDLPDKIDDLDWLMADWFNAIKKELCAALTELGTNPKGSFADVAAAIAACVKVAAPASGDILYHNGAAWVALPKSTDGYVLTLASGLPSWAAAGGGGFNFRTGDLLLSFNLSAPSGWTDISTTYDKYFLRIQKDTPLTTGGSDTHSHTLAETNLPSHSHAYGTLAAANEAAHTHGVGTIAAANENAHSHAIGTLAVGNESAHTHSISFTSGGESAHTHGAGSYGAASAGAHTHTVDNSEDAGGGASAYASPTPGANITTSSNGAHTHSVSGSSAAGANHTHAISGTSAAGSSHTHSLTGAPGAGTAHTHSLNGSTAAGSSHTHTLSGSTAAVGNATAFSGDNVPVWLGVRCYQKD